VQLNCDFHVHHVWQSLTDDVYSPSHVDGEAESQADFLVGLSRETQYVELLECIDVFPVSCTQTITLMTSLMCQSLFRTMSHCQSSGMLTQTGFPGPTLQNTFLQHSINLMANLRHLSSGYAHVLTGLQKWTHMDKLSSS
jgi:hypothetical protein